jgi:hypothetical protein
LLQRKWGDDVKMKVMMTIASLSLNKVSAIISLKSMSYFFFSFCGKCMSIEPGILYEIFSPSFSSFPKLLQMIPSLLDVLFDGTELSDSFDDVTCGVKNVDKRRRRDETRDRK